MMNGWNTGMGAGWWVLMSVFWIAVLAVIVWAAVRLFPSRSSGPAERESDRPEEILERRLARGEIDPETYDALRAKLGGGTLAGRR